MKSVKQSIAERLMAQAREADVQGLTKVAKSLDNQLSKIKLRQDDTHYVYSSNEFHEDVENKLWDIMVRAADFYGCNVDGGELQKVVEKAAEGLLSEFRVKSGVRLDVGANEPQMPGETREEAALIVEEI